MSRRTKAEMEAFRTAIYELVEDADGWNSTIAAEESEREIIARMLGGAS